MITKLSIRNYKSLEKVDLSLSALNVLVGPNASGKSNIIGALASIKAVVADGDAVTGVLKPYGGYQSVVWGGESERDIEIAVVWTARDTSKKEESCTYSMRFGLVGDDCCFKEEKWGGVAFRNLRDWHFDIISGGVVSSGHSMLKYITQLTNMNEIKSIKGWRFYRLAPRSMRPPRNIRQTYDLEEDGSNVSTVIHTLFSEEAPALQDITEFLKSTLPSTEKLLSPITPDGLTYVALKEQDVPIPVPSWNLSEGTLFTIALATALLSARPPTLLVIEAPDTELHPYLMEYIADLIVSASKRTQVIITTHSPYLVEHMPPDSLVIVEKIGGKTLVKPVRGRRGVREAIKQLGVGKAWYSGYLGGVP
ncbi:MAG: AAA family ATPase [Chloroflexi bacterium]|nr:AAA family ATPase [Chloroflexota bacterium]